MFEVDQGRECPRRYLLKSELDQLETGGSTGEEQKADAVKEMVGGKACRFAVLIDAPTLREAAQVSATNAEVVPSQHAKVPARVLKA